MRPPASCHEVIQVSVPLGHICSILPELLDRRLNRLCRLGLERVVNLSLALSMLIVDEGCHLLGHELADALQVPPEPALLLVDLDPEPFELSLKLV